MYHTKHDNFAWMTKFIDPDMRYHQTVAKVIMNVVLSIADDVILPFNLVTYSLEISDKVKELEINLKKKNLSHKVDISKIKIGFSLFATQYHAIEASLLKFQSFLPSSVCNI